MKIVFFGTPDYVVPVLEKLNKNFKVRGESPIAAVVTQEPKLTGRNHLKTFSAVDNWAHQHNKPIYFKPMDLVNDNVSADIAVLASFGKIVPEAVIKHFRYGIVNIHPSLLPAWRGSSPIQAQIISANKLTGVTFMKLDPQLDHGEIISQFKDEIQDSDTSATLKKRLFERAADVIVGLIPAYTGGKTRIKSQEDDKATFTKQLKREDGFVPPKFIKNALNGKNSKGVWEIRWIKADDQPYHLQPTTMNIFNFIRAMDPWPGAWSEIEINGNKKRIKILKTHLSDLQLILDEVQLEGKSPVTWKQFCDGYPQVKFK